MLAGKTSEENERLARVGAGNAPRCADASLLAAGSPPPRRSTRTRCARSRSSARSWCCTAHRLRGLPRPGAAALRRTVSCTSVSGFPSKAAYAAPTTAGCTTRRGSASRPRSESPSSRLKEAESTSVVTPCRSWGASSSGTSAPTRRRCCLAGTSSCCRTRSARSVSRSSPATGCSATRTPPTLTTIRIFTGTSSSTPSKARTRSARDARAADSSSHRAFTSIRSISGHDGVVVERDRYGFKKGIRYSVEKGAAKERIQWFPYNIFPFYSGAIGNGIRSQINMRIPLDDERTYHVSYVVYRAEGVEAPRQEVVPYYWHPIFDDQGHPILDYVLAQDIAAWHSQGTITDRTRETLPAPRTSRILEFRAIIEEQIRKVEAGEDPISVFRDREEMGSSIEVGARLSDRDLLAPPEQGRGYRLPEQLPSRLLQRRDRPLRPGRRAGRRPDAPRRRVEPTGDLREAGEFCPRSRALAQVSVAPTDRFQGPRKGRRPPRLGVHADCGVTSLACR